MESLAWALSLGILGFWDIWFRIFGLGSFAWDLWLGIFGLGSKRWDLGLGDLGLEGLLLRSRCPRFGVGLSCFVD